MNNKITQLASEKERAFIERLKQARKEQGLSFQNLADQAGVHRTAISLVERGERHPSLLLCLKLCECLNLNPKDLF